MKVFAFFHKDVSNPNQAYSMKWKVKKLAPKNRNNWLEKGLGPKQGRRSGKWQARMDGWVCRFDGVRNDDNC